MRMTTVSLLAFAMLSVGCGGKEVLIPKPAGVPVGVDLSGQWLLRDTSGTTQRAAREALVYAFYESGRSVKVTQTETGLFISFDRSVVEEYRFGENRTVSVGEIAADRVSGWEGDAYVIETLDKDGTKLIDRYRVDRETDVLTRSTVIRTRNDTRQLSLQQVYDRV